MATSTASSPARESNPDSPAQLTPNSKVRAMLATLDKDSDDESVSGFVRANLIKASTKTAPSKPASPHQQVEKSDLASNSEVLAVTEKNTDDDEEEEDIIRPKGRLAARMQIEEESSQDDVVSVADNARDRVRKLLSSMAKNKSPESSTTTNDVDASDESDAPVISRKRKITKRTSTFKSSPARSAQSPGLFVSPERPNPTSPGVDGSDSDNLPVDLASGDRFKALVERKRQERLAREADLAEEKAKKIAERKRFAEVLEDEDDVSDDNVERRLTQPTRKASKKAQEEIRRETQRLSRNQQLAHYATTKKKYPKSELFARFNYRQDAKSDEVEPARPTSSSSMAHPSDMEMKDTPPTSPASQGEKAIETHNLLPVTNDDDELSTHVEALTQIPSSPPTKMDKGKGRTVEEPATNPITESALPKKKPVFTQRSIRVMAPKVADRKSVGLADSDSDLEIVSAKTPNARRKRLDSIFDRVPAKQAKESHSLYALRMLAHVTSPGKKTFGKNKKLSMTTTELQISLQQRARQQATRDREEKLQSMRDRGIIIQTAEEIQHAQADADDMLARARQEGEEIMKREKAAAKKERKENGEVDPLEDSSDDEDWEEEKDKAEKELAISGLDDENEESSSDELELSGEDEEDEEMEEEETLETVVNPMFDDEAAESEEDGVGAENEMANEEMAEDGDIDEDDEEQQLPAKKTQRRNRKTNIISDDEDGDEEDNKATPLPPHTNSSMPLNTDSPVAPNSVLRSATKTFIPGVTVTGPVGLGLTQIFAGTMDESQVEPDEASLTQQLDYKKNSLAFLRGYNAPELPPFVPTMEEDTQDQDVIMDSQSGVANAVESQSNNSISPDFQFQFNQSQIHGFDSLVEESQLSQFPEPSQDVGFQHMTPIRGRFTEAPPSTVDTVVLAPTELPETMEETPIVKKKGRLRQRAQVATFSDEEDVSAAKDDLEDEFDITADAFDVMRKASKKKIVIEEFDKKNSKAKDMVHEQADESEDEYAGLGGASDDESGEEDVFVKEMINDEGGKDDEGKLAAFFADRERASDEKQVEKLYKDITNGMLRRKRGADYDLSDSDDGGEARKRRKRAEFAKMRKALLADERIGKIAENPKRQAFLRAIEDRGSEDEMDFLDDFAEQEDGTDSQSQSQGEGSQLVVPDSQPTVMGPPKRKASQDVTDAANRLPPNLRRTKPGKKPTNLSEIRESLSSLIDEPNAVVAHQDSASESEDELEIEGEADGESHRGRGKENLDPFALRRSKDSVIDRISLKRASSAADSANTRLAFTITPAAPGFKVPPLLRRATTNSSIASSTSSSVSGGMSATERMAGGSGSDGVKRGGGKNSGVHYFARETERRAAVVKTEKRREQKRFKGAEVRRKAVGGLFGGGKFE